MEKSITKKRKAVFILFLLFVFSIHAMVADASSEFLTCSISHLEADAKETHPAGLVQWLFAPKTLTMGNGRIGVKDASEKRFTGETAKSARSKLHEDVTLSPSLRQTLFNSI